MLLFKKLKKTKVFLKTETKKHALLRFAFLILSLIGYFLYVASKFGTSNGILVTILTWSFFVFCTPIADAGFLLAFPVRLFLGIRMVYTQVFAYGVALVINIFTLLFLPSIYARTMLLRLFRQILTTPWPYWSIIILSLIGTFASIYFGDELMDVSCHKERKKYHKHLNKYKLLVFIFIVVFTAILYDFLLYQIGIQVPLL